MVAKARVATEMVGNSIKEGNETQEAKRYSNQRATPRCSNHGEKRRGNWVFIGPQESISSHSKFDENTRTSNTSERWLHFSDFMFTDQIGEDTSHERKVFRISRGGSLCVACDVKRTVGELGILMTSSQDAQILRHLLHVHRNSQ